MTQNLLYRQKEGWQIPKYDSDIFFEKKREYCIVIPVFNEGERIRSVLKKLETYTHLVDVFVLDKGSTDDSLNHSFLKEQNVRGIFTLREEGRLSSQLRMGYAHALSEGYEGVVTIDGNDKDDVDALPRFISLLKKGYDFVQASRYIQGGKGVNTPAIRDFAIRIIHAPVISLLSGFRYTDTTQGYRAYSKRILSDSNIAPFREIFTGYELLAYLSVRIPKLGYKVIETPVQRTYPPNKKTPTKISFIKGNLELLSVLWGLCFKKYDPR